MRTAESSDDDEPLPKTRIASVPELLDDEKMRTAESSDDDEPLPKTRIASVPEGLDDEKMRPAESSDDDEPLPKTRIASVPEGLLDDEGEVTRIATTPELFDDEDEQTRIAVTPERLLDEGKKPDVPSPEDDAPAIAKPRAPVPRPGALGKIPRPPVPPPRGLGSVPRPGGRPSVPRPSIPKPGARPAIPRPPLPSIPRPGGAKAPGAKAGGPSVPLPRPGKPVPPPQRPVAPPAPSEELPELDFADLEPSASVEVEKATETANRLENAKAIPAETTTPETRAKADAPPDADAAAPVSATDAASEVDALAPEADLETRATADAPIADEDGIDALALAQDEPVAADDERGDERALVESSEPAADAPEPALETEADEAREPAEAALDTASAGDDAGGAEREDAGGEAELAPSTEDAAAEIQSEDDAAEIQSEDAAAEIQSEDAAAEIQSEDAAAEFELSPPADDMAAELDAAIGEMVELAPSDDAVDAPDDELDALLTGSDDDDDELVIEASEDDGDELIVDASAEDDDEWSDEDWEAIEAAEAEQQRQAEQDRGAMAARRSVRSRKPRDESFPMVDGGAEALRLRRRLLMSLAESRDGGIRARLLVSAAELAEQLGDADGARELYRSAIEADPADVVALRALRRDAMARGAWDDLAELFAKEAQLDLSTRERGLALTGLAEIALTRRGDAAAAERAAARALELDPESLSARLLTMEARLAQNNVDGALDALAPAADAWDDERARAAVKVLLARHVERAGDTARARSLFGEAAALDPKALDALAGLARTASRADGDPTAAVDALARLAEHLSGPSREAVLTRASRVATLLAGDAARGVSLLADATGVLPLQARAEAAANTADRQTELDALSAWASAAGGTDRALALVRKAEALAAGGDIDGAEAALRDASLADGSLGTIRVVREIIARRAGDVSRLVESVEAGGALAAAARVASDPGALERERELLGAAASEGNALVTADVLALDVAAAQGEDEAIDAALRRQADRMPPERRVGSLLALAERAIERNDLESAEALLSEARALVPGNPLVLRPLGRLALQRDPTTTAALWLEESSVASGERAAYAATEAGRVLAQSGGDALGAYRRALDAVPGYGPAAWLLKPLATEVGDPLTLGDVHEQLAETAADPIDAAGHLVRGALLRAHADPDGAGGLLEQARALAPDDAILQSLIMRSANGTAPADRAAMLAASAESASPILARVFRLQAAGAYEDAGDPAAAAAQYRAIAETHPEDPSVRFGLDRAEIAADQVARVAERRFAAVKEAETEERRVLALERLADLDQHERKDPASAVLSLQSILETAPGHLPSLRALQRYFAEHGRTEDAAEVVERMAEHVQEGPDVTSHVRLARRLRLADPEASGEVADAMLVGAAPRAELDLWLAPRVLAAALAQEEDEAAADAARRLAELLATASERASARVRASELMAPEDALAILAEASRSAPQHPIASSTLAQACERAEHWEEAAEAWEQAARASEVREHGAAYFDRAGRLWETRLQNKERARRAYEAASERDVTHGDLFERLRAILKADGDRERLAELYTQRLAAGGDTAQLVDLYVAQAELYTDLRDLSNAKSALRAALALMPERIDALRALANLSLEDEDWRGAAEVLIRIARIRKEREELRWVFFTLGDIYDQHMPDPRRAEAAFKRVLKLFPQDVPAMERLATLHEREGQHQAAGEMLAELARLDVDPERNRAHRLKLSQTFEQLGDARRAEQVLEQARKNAPTDLAVLRAFADFYQRQNAANAMAMHLNRAVNDFRHALEADLGDAAAWPGLVEVLTWRGDTDAAAVAASAAQSLGIVDIEMSKLVDSRGAAPGLEAGAAMETLDELLAPPQLPAPTRAVFRLAGEALERSLPFDVGAYRAEKINPRDTQIRPIALEVGRWFGISDPQLYVTSAAPRVCVPVYSNPVTVLIGSELLGITDDREKLFVLVRAFKIAHAQLSVVVRAQPQELAALMGGLVSGYDPNHVAPGADPAQVAEDARRIAKNVPRRARDELGPLVFEMAGRPGYDPGVFAMAASEWGNRTALVASGSMPAGLSALAKLSGERELPSDSGGAPRHAHPLPRSHLAALLRDLRRALRGAPSRRRRPALRAGDAHRPARSGGG